MFERILQIIVFVVKELNQNKSIDQIKFHHLYNLGYSDVEISTAITWIMDKVGLDRWEAPKVSSFRVLSPVEQQMFDADALSELMQYIALGLVSNDQLEEILDRAVFNGIRKIDKQTLTYIITALVLNIPPSYGYGSRVVLSVADTVH